MRNTVLILSAVVGSLARPAAAAGARRTAAVVLVPQDKGAHAAAARITEYFEDAIAASPGYHLSESSEKLFGVAVPNEANEALSAGKADVAEGKRLFQQGFLEEAEAKLRSALKALERAAPVLEKCAEYCDATAYLGAVLQMKSDDNSARDLAKTVLILDPKYRFEGRSFGQNYTLVARELAKTMARDVLVSTASIYSNPPGGKVFVDGKMKGYTPLSIDQIAAGKHLVRIERPGAYVWGQVATVGATEDAVIKAKLTSTPEFASLDQLLDGLGAEVEKGNAGAGSLALCAKLKVDRAVVGVVRSASDNVVLEAMLVDAMAKRRVARKRVRFEGEEYGQLEREVGKFANALLTEGERKSERVTSKDPLDQVSGTEDWSDEPVTTSDEGGRGSRRRKAPPPEERMDE